jgi:hypothetical protein
MAACWGILRVRGLCQGRVGDLCRQCQKLTLCDDAALPASRMPFRNLMINLGIFAMRRAVGELAHGLHYQFVTTFTKTDVTSSEHDGGEHDASDDSGLD